MHYINYNGELMAAGAISVPSDSHMLRYGFGLFETMLVRDGAIALAAYHWERLFAGMQQLYFGVVPFTADQLTAEVLRCVGRNGMERLARVRLQVFAGTGGFPEGLGQSPGFLVECHQPDPELLTWNERGLITGIAEGLYKSHDMLANLKTTSMIPYIMAAQQAQRHNWDDAFLLNTQQRVIESTIANVFWIKDGEVYTPPLSEGCIAGVMRRFIMEASGIAVTERLLTSPALHTADEIFLTNAIRGVRWVQACCGNAYSHNKTREIYRVVAGNH